MKKSVWICSLATLLPFTVFAHEGHGHTHGFTITHYFVEPEHLLFLLIVWAGAFFLFRSFAKKKEKTLSDNP